MDRRNFLNMNIKIASNLLKKKNVDKNIIIKIIGVGGGGCNVINKMIASNVDNVDFVAINTDVQSLLKSSANDVLQIGEKITKGLGVGGNPEIGRQSAEENIEEIKNKIIGSDIVFIAACMGGGTGTGVAPIIAKFAKNEKILTIGIVTKPFEHEGKIRMLQAEEGIKNLKKYTDVLITIPNDRVFNVINEKASLESFYQIIDDVLRQIVQAITNVITMTGEINRDFADIKNILTNAGTALIGIGESIISNVKDAVKKAIINPLLDTYDISKAKKILVNITTNSNISALTLKEIFNDIKSYGINGHIFFGHIIDNKLDDKIKVTIIATGFKNDVVIYNNDENQTLKTDAFIDSKNNFYKKEKEYIDPLKPAYTYWKPKFLKNK
jgi:cell division protein FtsZ